MSVRLSVVTEDTELIDPELREERQETVDIDNDIRFSTPSAEDEALKKMERSTVMWELIDDNYDRLIECLDDDELAAVRLVEPRQSIPRSDMEKGAAAMSLPLGDFVALWKRAVCRMRDGLTLR